MRPFSKIRAIFRRKPVDLNLGGPAETGGAARSPLPVSEQPIGKPLDSLTFKKRYTVNLVGLILGAVTLALMFIGGWHGDANRTPLGDTWKIPAIIASCVLFSVFLLVIFIALIAIRKGRVDNKDDYSDDSEKKAREDAKPELKKEGKKSGGGFLSYFFGTIAILLLLGVLGFGASIALPLFQAWATNADPELAITNFFKDVPSMKIDETPCKEPADHELDEATIEFVVKLKEGCKTLIVTPQNRSNKWRWWEISWVHHLPAPQNCARYQFFGSAGWKGPYCGPENPPDPGNLPDVKGRMYAEGRGELLFRRVQ